MAATKGKRDKSDIFKILFILESNGMNVSAAWRETLVPRSTIKFYQDRYWDEYVLYRGSLQNNSSIAISEARIEVANKEMAIYKLEIGDLHRLALSKLKQAVKDDKVKPNLLLNILKETAPYIMEREGVKGVVAEGSDMATKHTNFVQNVINKMQIYGNKGN